VRRPTPPMRTAADHPRPFLQRPWQSLDGTWEFALDRERRFDRPADVHFDATILVPFAPETPAAGVGAEDGGVTGYIQRCWYRRTFTVEPPTDGERVIVHFNGVDRIADVWASGEHVGHHVGGYAAFSADITTAARTGAVELIVSADDDGHDLSVPRGKQDWQPTPHSIFYPRTTGIWKTVWLERVPAMRVERLTWSTDASSMTVTMRADIAGVAEPENADALNLRVRLTVGSDDQHALVDDVVTVTGRGATRTVERTFGVGDGSLDDRFRLTWWRRRRCDRVVHRDPHGGGGRRAVPAQRSPLPPTTGARPGLLARHRRHAGRHRLAAARHRTDQGPRFQRCAQAPEDRRSTLFRTRRPSRPAHLGRDAERIPTRPRSSANVLREWADIVEAHRNHPSVVAWVPINESWGVTDCEHDRSQRALIEALCAKAVALDGTRPVSANDGWETVGGEIVGVHDYDQDPEALTSRWGDRAAVDAVIAGRRPDGRTVDLDHSPAATRAVVLSEFGGIAMAVDTGGGSFSLGNQNWGYDSATSPDDLLRRYREQWAVVHASSALAGACWTQLTDTYQEVNGLLTADRQPKADLTRLAAATRTRGKPPE